MLCVYGGLLFLVALLYDIFDWRDFRTLAPMAFGLFVWIVLRQKMLPMHKSTAKAATIAIVLLFAFYFFPAGHPLNPSFERVTETSVPTGLWLSILQNDPEISSIVLLDVRTNYNLVATVPPRIGMLDATTLQDMLDEAPKYALISPDYEADMQSAPYQFVGDVPGYGNLYVRTEESAS